MNSFEVFYSLKKVIEFIPLAMVAILIVNLSLKKNQLIDKKDNLIKMNIYSFMTG